MAALNRPATNARPRYEMAEVFELRRLMLQFAHAMPPGSERNQHRQVAASLRRLVQNEAWLLEHVVQPRQRGANRPIRRCDGCSAQMTHLSDLPGSLRGPPVRIFRCYSCNHVVSEDR